METFTLTDEEIEKQVHAQLQWDSRLANEGVLIKVDDNDVTLSGTVPTYTDRVLAEENAKLVYGVHHVDNRLIVSLPGGTRIPTDAELQANIESIFKWSTHLQDEDIDISVRDRHVVLSGSVSEYWKRPRATQLASEIQGVREITNEIAIVPTEQPADEATAEDIMDALARDARIDVESVDVKVKDGHVTLFGKLDSMEDYRVVDNIARFTFGVVDVDNLMTIELERA